MVLNPLMPKETLLVQEHIVYFCLYRTLLKSYGWSTREDDTNQKTPETLSSLTWLGNTKATGTQHAQWAILLYSVIFHVLCCSVTFEEIFHFCGALNMVKGNLRTHDYVGCNWEFLLFSNLGNSLCFKQGSWILHVLKKGPWTSLVFIWGCRTCFVFFKRCVFFWYPIEGIMIHSCKDSGKSQS